jgi:hypothetical protein
MKGNQKIGSSHRQFLDNNLSPDRSPDAPNKEERRKKENGRQMGELEAEEKEIEVQGFNKVEKGQKSPLPRRLRLAPMTSALKLKQ